MSDLEIQLYLILKKMETNVSCNINPISPVFNELSSGKILNLQTFPAFVLYRPFKYSCQQKDSNTL